MRIALFSMLGVLAFGGAVADTITYDIQQAGYSFDQFDDKGPATYESFRKAFREFPWAQQVGRSNGGSEPTISVKNHTRRVDLWVSAVQHRSGYDYLVGVVYQKHKRPLLGFGRPTEIRWVEIYVAEKAEVVESVFKSFFSGTHEEVMNQLRALPKFAEMEARR